MQNPLIQQLAARNHLSAEERIVLRDLIETVKDIGAGRVIVTAGSCASESCLILEGLAGQYKSLAGRRRQITAFYFPGDFVDLHSFLLKRVDQGTLALTNCKVGIVPHQTLQEISEHHPRLTRLLWLCTLIDAAAYREWVAVLGHLPAQARAAHLFCEFFLRLKLSGLTNGSSFALPITQAKLAESLGVSNVHLNRVLQQLRTKRVVMWENDVVTILDWKQLNEVAHYDPTYLHLRCDCP